MKKKGQDIRITTRLPAYPDDEVLLGVPVDTKAISRWAEVNGSSGFVILYVVGVGSGTNLTSGESTETL